MKYRDIKDCSKMTFVATNSYRSFPHHEVCLRATFEQSVNTQNMRNFAFAPCPTSLSSCLNFSKHMFLMKVLVDRKSVV